MAIISQETFEKFTKEEKEKIRNYYKQSVELSENGIDEEERLINTNIKWQTELFFGKENLQSKPEIKTWKDVEKEYPKIEIDFKNLNVDINCCCGIESKIGKKMLATAKIAKLIELGYGSIITDEEWRDKNYYKFTILYDKITNKPYLGESRCTGHFIAFHTKQQAGEFISYAENVELVEQYNLR